MLVSMERTSRVVARAGTSLWRTVGVLSEAGPGPTCFSIGPPGGSLLTLRERRAGRTSSPAQHRLLS